MSLMGFRLRINTSVACVPALIHARGAPEHFLVEQGNARTVLVRMYVVCALPSAARTSLKPGTAQGGKGCCSGFRLCVPLAPLALILERSGFVVQW